MKKNEILPVRDGMGGGGKRRVRKRGETNIETLVLRSWSLQSSEQIII